MRLSTPILAVAIALVAVRAPAQAPPDAPNQGVPPARLARLSKGVNIAHWLWLPASPDADSRRAYFTDADAERLKSLGLTHIRLPVHPDVLWNAKAEALDPDGVAELRRAIDLLLSRGLAVVVDVQVSDHPWLDLDADGRIRSLERLWDSLAPKLAPTDPERVFLEIVNEPHGLPDGAWAKAQPHILRIIRAGAPSHTIIATGDGYSSIDALVALEPLDDANVIYTFHFYEPHNFTHQGATWGFAPWRHMKNLPWPATIEELNAAADKLGDERAATAVRWSAKEPWNAEFINKRIARAVAWRDKHHVPVWCGEFGVYRSFCAPESRLRWLNDTTTALNRKGIGWAMWDYAGGFGLMTGEPGARKLDTDTAATLRLKPAQADPAGAGTP